jgi:RimJ/RimL family protein N-acetyltransferase
MPFATPPAVLMTLNNDTRVEMRPVMRADRDRLAEGFKGLSEASRYQRFFTPAPRLSGSQLRYLTDIDHVDHFAWGVQTADGTGVGIARYVRTGSDMAEAAFTIADAYQRLGVGWTLLRALAMIAADHDLRRFEMTMLADNAAMAHLARKAGADFDPPTGGTVRAELRLDPALWSDLANATELRRLAARAAQAA